jgi:dsDNA-binding SOS-regulon protein
MGTIKEPKGVDFIIDSSSMTDEDREKISLWISERKAAKSTNFKLNGVNKTPSKRRTNKLKKN